MDNLAIILPYKKDSKQRETNFYYIKRRYKKMFPKAQLLVAGENTKHIYYNKSKAINNAVKYLKDNVEYLMICDTDIIIERDSIIESLHLLKRYGLILPYNKVSKLDKSSSHQILKYDNFNNLNFEIEWAYNNKPNYLGGGGIQILKRETFEEIGGYNELFKGWGDEDICFCIHLSLFHEIRKLDNVVYHLWHPTQESKKTGERKLNKRLRQIYTKIYNNEKYAQRVKNDMMMNLKSTPKVDFLATEEHFVHHLLPLYYALSEENRGDFFTTQMATNLEWSIHRDKPEEIVKRVNLYNKHRLLVMASLLTPIAQNINRPIGWIAHGAGQVYSGARWRYRENNNLFLALCPNDYYANFVKNNTRCKNIKVIGSPKLDKWYDYKKSINFKPIVALSFHHDRKACPESTSAFPHFRSVLPDLFRQEEWQILGHGHPRMIDKLIPLYEKYNIEYTRDFEEILRRADLYICDHMSTLYEFAAVDDKPVVVLNAPWYRREVEHGLRFWEHSDVGINCNYPKDLLDCIQKALKDSEHQKRLREKCLKAVYKYRDGDSTQRAVHEILKLIHKKRFMIEAFDQIDDLNCVENKKNIIHSAQQLPIDKVIKHKVLNR